MSSLVASDLDEIEDALKKLRISYEKYFAGVDRVEPLKERDGVKRSIMRLLGDNSKNTARRFRLQTLNASLVTYEQYWNRITRQIEEGTFKRDRVRADRILKAAGLEPRNPLAEVLAEMGPEMGPDLVDDLEVDDGDVMPMDDDDVTPAAPATATAAPKPAAASLAGVDEALAMAAQATSRPRPTTPRPATAPATATRPAAAKPEPSSVPPAPTTGYSASVRQLHQSYVAARLGTGDRDPVSLDAFAATLQKQAAAIKSRFSCNEVEFKVALKDGRAILKATPR
jgi:hypothetical protein